ncbi:DNA polymerase III subunit delta [Candidatus Phytoplasma melaleucae]|uniref:DNA polymerase III subunit delta n=1 Tax=Candidatus Phytoplasma melaleucae TaxID=2982630 RepID=A0ABT9DFC3_9MOLU|nr:DNA polymerase III subunit delta ['Melaleuca sp.' phytoplasma]MDO8167996.1 DNA polymerase III subunit delta ['Melaleuca sp.' phytoplasma]MDO8168003.1 DNA polymerase III subunit delta ['Melaleuca sp.' phytoplasma]
MAVKRVVYLSLLCYSQLFFLEREKNYLVEFCHKNNYYFYYCKFESHNYFDIMARMKELLSTGNFFSQKKVFFIENISLLFELKKVDYFSFLVNYLNKSSDQNIIMYVTLDENNHFFALVKNKLLRFAQVLKIKSIHRKDDLFSYILNTFTQEGFFINETIKDKFIYRLIQKTNGDLFLLSEEINKIKLYHLPKKKIHDESVIEQLTYASEDTSVLTLIEFIISEKSSISDFAFFQKTVSQKKDIFLFLYRILKKLQEMIVAERLLRQNISQKQISSLLKYSSVKTFFLAKELRSFNIERVVSLFLFFFELYFEMQLGIKAPDIRFLFMAKTVLFN